MGRRRGVPPGAVELGWEDGHRRRKGTVHGQQASSVRALFCGRHHHHCHPPSTPTGTPHSTPHHPPVPQLDLLMLDSILAANPHKLTPKHTQAHPSRPLPSSLLQLQLFRGTRDSILAAHPYKPPHRHTQGVPPFPLPLNSWSFSATHATPSWPPTAPRPWWI